MKVKRFTMKKPLIPYLTEDTSSEDAGTLRSLQDVLAKQSNHAATFNCDTCEQIVAIEEAVTSPVLPYSRFCSTACRNEAEQATEDARCP